VTDITYYSSARETVVFSEWSFHLVFFRGPHVILFCMHSIVPTLSCNLLRIIILVSTLTRPFSNCNDEMRLRYSMACRYYLARLSWTKVNRLDLYLVATADRIDQTKCVRLLRHSDLINIEMQTGQGVDLGFLAEVSHKIKVKYGKQDVDNGTSYCEYDYTVGPQHPIQSVIISWRSS
jgi:hypothetical protein